MKLIDIFVFAGLALMVLVDSSSAQENWRGIVPLVTTQAEIERMLGLPKNESNENYNFSEYELEEGEVTIRFVDLNCGNPDYCECLAPVGTVRNIILRLNTFIRLENLKLDLSEFSKIQNTGQPEMFTYSNERTGVIFSVEDGEIYKINYNAPAHICEKLIAENPIRTKCDRRK